MLETGIIFVYLLLLREGLGNRYDWGELLLLLKSSKWQYLNKSFLSAPYKGLFSCFQFGASMNISIYIIFFSELRTSYPPYILSDGYKH